MSEQQRPLIDYRIMRELTYEVSDDGLRQAIQRHDELSIIAENQGYEIPDDDRDEIEALLNEILIIHSILQTIRKREAAARQTERARIARSSVRSQQQAQRAAEMGTYEI